MRIVGIKYNHDASVAMIEDGRLVFSFEMEKINNRKRYTVMEDKLWIDEALSEAGYSAADVDRWAVDAFNAPENHSFFGLPLAPYTEDERLTKRFKFPPSSILANGRRPYSSFHHTYSHVAGAYAMSDYEDCYCLVWDGGMWPRLYEKAKVGWRFIGELLGLSGSIYGIMGHYWGPFRSDAIRALPFNPCVDGGKRFAPYEWPGKLMAYIGLGRPNAGLSSQIRSIADRLPKSPDARRGYIEHAFCREILYSIPAAPDEDVLLAVHDALKDAIIASLTKLTRSGSSIIFTGGSALNIKWNSAIRACGHFLSVFVPPVPNDAGTAIGAAVAERIYQTGIEKINWRLFSGPAFVIDEANDGWTKKAVTPEAVALILVNEPVLSLFGPSEIGPRALGHRSILANPGLFGNKALLNRLKGRENYRPVAPICLEAEAPNFFCPGTKDPFMLFDHAAIPRVADLIPAVLHIDGTARLQTVSASDPIICALLNEFRKLTGLPMLCNTSANESGAGFFSRLSHAMAWAERVGIRKIWIGDSASLWERENEQGTSLRFLYGFNENVSRRRPFTHEQRQVGVHNGRGKAQVNRKGNSGQFAVQGHRSLLFGLRCDGSTGRL
jgi:carbamoyltransferase